jgi:LPPG:FO 2-phospho-L-lactate transferase
VKVTALAGGVGGAKLLVGFDGIDGIELTAIVNTGDDAEIYGLHVSPDIDIVTYWLAGLADTDRGWGIRGDGFEVVGALEDLGIETWFRLGDRDLATCLVRTQRLASGDKLSAITADIAGALGVRPHIIPMTDDRVRTKIVAADGRTLDFQEYFVKERCEPDVAEVLFDGVSDAAPAPGVLDAIAAADKIVLCPSNPIVSIGPILALRGVRDALREHRAVTALSPIVRGAALKGPADRMMKNLASGASASAVARLYADLCDLFVVDATDEEETSKIAELGMRSVALDTIMVDAAASARLARAVLDA